MGPFSIVVLVVGCVYVYEGIIVIFLFVLCQQISVIAHKHQKESVITLYDSKQSVHVQS